jgi:hypothetical protein
MFLTTLALATALRVANAQVPRLITFQGKLTDAQTNVVTGAFNLTFRLFDTNTGGSYLWAETHTNVAVTRGVFAVPLGVTNSLNLPFDRKYWVSIQVGSDREMNARIPLNSAPYAIRADTAAVASDTVAVGGTPTNQLGFVPIGAIIAWAKNLPSLDFRVRSLPNADWVLAVQTSAGFIRR